MANPTAGFGLRPVRRLDGAALSFQLIERQIVYNESGSLFTGDLAQADVGGYIQPYTAADAVTAGVFWGCKYKDPSSGMIVWRPSWQAVSGLASTDKVYAYLIADPNIEFEIRSAGGTAAAVGIADIGANFEVTVGSGSTTTGQSATTLLNTPATTATLPLKMTNLAPLVPSGFNDPTLVNNIVLVKLNTLFWVSSTGITT